MSCGSVLVTGASGFVGGALLRSLTSGSARHVVATVRSLDAKLPTGVEIRAVGDITGSTDWSAALQGVELVIHAAARVHIVTETAGAPLDAFREVNVFGTLALATQAAAQGVKRFIFLSSIKVNGELSQPGRPFGPDDTPAPVDPYGQSKLEAEQSLLALAARTGMEVVIIRPVLVYGPGVKANFLAMMRWLDRGIPLPLGAVYNRRSFVFVDNLVDLALVCMEHPAAPGQVFLASDGLDLSTTQLIRLLGSALGRPPRLVPVPASWLRRLGGWCGKSAFAQRLLGDLQVDIEKNRRLLDWIPPVSVETALARTATAFKEIRKG